MLLQRGFCCLKKKLCLYHQKKSYQRLLETPDEKNEESHQHYQYHHHQKFSLLTTPKGFVPIMVGEFEGNKEGKKKYMIQVEYLSTPTFKAMIYKLWEEQPIELELEDHNHQGPMKLPCSPAAFEHVLDACDEHNCIRDRWRFRFHKLCAVIGHERCGSC